MRDAAVGYQCPSCVAEGRKDTRSGRTLYGGVRPSRQGVVSISLIAVNALVWLAILASGGSGSNLFYRLALIPRGVCTIGDRGQYYPAVVSSAQCALTQPGSSWLEGVATGAPYQLVTSMFSHVQIWHIAFNMLALWVLGSQLEMVLGRVRYLGLYLLSGLVGSAAVLLFSSPETPTLGASGAIFGLMGALVVFAFKLRADMQQLLIWIGINFALTFFGRAYISWEGHLGGFVGGALLAAVLAYAPRERRSLWQAGGFGAVFLAVVVVVLVRVSALT